MLPSLAALGITPNPRLAAGGERAARQRLERFVRGPGPRYHELRDRLDQSGTSRLSVDLKFGTLSARKILHEVERGLGPSEALSVFRRELVWREFAHHLLWDRPELLSLPFRAEFQGFPWTFAPEHWQAWTQGKTGYPIVDACARQLLGEGFVHNRGRMIAASFLTKHLLISYRRGEAHYLKYLTDGDWAQNNAGWQWSAGSGCDAQPYFRIFNPVTQGQKFDPEGAYVRRWVPELEALPAPYIHAPWEAPSAVLQRAGIELGVNYPGPIVDHRQARERFLQVSRQHLTQARRAQLGANSPARPISFFDAPSALM